MALIDTIRATMRTVVGSSRGLGEAWWYRTITSAPTNQTTPTWSAWATVDAVVSGRHVADVADPRSGKLSQRNRQFFAISDIIVLPMGSQVSIDQVILWAVDDLTSAEGGTAKYLIGRDPVVRAQGNRGGGEA